MKARLWRWEWGGEGDTVPGPDLNPNRFPKLDCACAGAGHLNGYILNVVSLARLPSTARNKIKLAR